jgi:hypothetical protein
MHVIVQPLLAYLLLKAQPNYSSTAEVAFLYFLLYNLRINRESVR